MPLQIPHPPTHRIHMCISRDVAEECSTGHFQLASPEQHTLGLQPSDCIVFYWMGPFSLEKGRQRRCAKSSNTEKDEAKNNAFTTHMHFRLIQSMVKTAQVRHRENSILRERAKQPQTDSQERLCGSSLQIQVPFQTTRKDLLILQPWLPFCAHCQKLLRRQWNELSSGQPQTPPPLTFIKGVGCSHLTCYTNSTRLIHCRR